jgi:hypothetical protein
MPLNNPERQSWAIRFTGDLGIINLSVPECLSSSLGQSLQAQTCGALGVTNISVRE